jgi:hypothetical protein
MEKISLNRRGALSKEERDTFNNVLYQRAQKFAEQENYRLALSDLLRITPDFADYSEARKKIKQYSQPKDLDKPAVAKPTAISAKTAAPVETAPAATPSPPVISPAQKPEEKAPKETALTPQVTTKKVKDGTLVTTSRWNYTDDDVAKYDKMLADYFSVERLATRRTIKDGLGVSAQSKEPPSFREWLDQGKPNF